MKDITNPSPAWAVSSDGEHYDHGDFPTRGDAIEEGKVIYEGEPFYVGQLEPPIAPEDLFDCADWLEHVSEQDDYSGEHAEGWDHSTTEQREELNKEVRKVMAAWLERHSLRPSFFNIPAPERINPSDGWEGSTEEVNGSFNR